MSNFEDVFNLHKKDTVEPELTEVRCFEGQVSYEKKNSNKHEINNSTKEQEWLDIQEIGKVYKNDFERSRKDSSTVLMSMTMWNAINLQTRRAMITNYNIHVYESENDPKRPTAVNRYKIETWSDVKSIMKMVDCMQYRQVQGKKRNPTNRKKK